MHALYGCIFYCKGGSSNILKYTRTMWWRCPAQLHAQKWSCFQKGVSRAAIVTEAVIACSSAQQFILPKWLQHHWWSAEGDTWKIPWVSKGPSKATSVPRIYESESANNIMILYWVNSLTMCVVECNRENWKSWSLNPRPSDYLQLWADLRKEVTSHKNAKFWHFSSYHHFKAVRASDFILGLGAHQAFCFTNPTFEAVDSLLLGSMCTCHAHTGSRQGLEFFASVVEWV